jgi:hypothetical protein
MSNQHEENAMGGYEPEQSQDNAKQDFATVLYDMKLGQRITENPMNHYSFVWLITRVASGWIYTNERGQGHSVFVPFDDRFDGSF